MLEILYGSKGGAGIAWEEISQGRDVVLTVRGWRKRAVYRIISTYAEYRAQLAERGRANKSFGWRLLYQSILAPSILGLCEHARESGFAVSAKGVGDTLKVSFSKQALVEEGLSRV